MRACGNVMDKFRGSTFVGTHVINLFIKIPEINWRRWPGRAVPTPITEQLHGINRWNSRDFFFIDFLVR
jgi:hypothetical protein